MTDDPFIRAFKFLMIFLVTAVSIIFCANYIKDSDKRKYIEGCSREMPIYECVYEWKYGKIE